MRHRLRGSVANDNAALTSSPLSKVALTALAVVIDHLNDKGVVTSREFGDAIRLACARVEHERAQEADTAAGALRAARELAEFISPQAQGGRTQRWRPRLIIGDRRS